MTQQYNPAQLEAWAGLGPWVIVVDAHFPYNGHVRDQSKDEHVCGVFGEVEASDEFDSTITPDDNAALIAAAPDLARLVLEKEKEIARLKERIEHAHNTARRFYDTNKFNAGQYFLHICDILEPQAKP